MVRTLDCFQVFCVKILQPAFTDERLSGGLESHSSLICKKPAGRPPTSWDLRSLLITYYQLIILQYLFLLLNLFRPTGEGGGGGGGGPNSPPPPQTPRPPLPPATTRPPRPPKPGKYSQVFVLTLNRIIGLKLS